MNAPQANNLTRLSRMPDAQLKNVLEKIELCARQGDFYCLWPDTNPLQQETVAELVRRGFMVFRPVQFTVASSTKYQPATPHTKISWE